MKKVFFLIFIIQSINSYAQDTFCDGWNSAVASEGYGGTAKFPCVDQQSICLEPETPYSCGFKAALKEINEYKNQKTDDDVIQELKTNLHYNQSNSNSWKTDDLFVEDYPEQKIKQEPSYNPNMILPPIRFGSDFINSLTPAQKEAIRKRNSERIDRTYFKNRGEKIDQWQFGNNRVFSLNVNYVPISNDAKPDSTRYSYIRLRNIYSVGVNYRVKSYLHVGLSADYQQRYFSPGPSMGTSFRPSVQVKYEKRWYRNFLSIQIKGSLPSYENPYGWVGGNYSDYRSYYIGDINSTIHFGYLIYYPHSIHIEAGSNMMYYQSPITASSAIPDPLLGNRWNPFLGIGYSYYFLF